MSKQQKNIVLSLFSLVFTVGLTIVLDYTVGWLSPPGLIYPPNTAVTIKTTEFEFIGHINKQGFRGEPFKLPPDKAFRVITLGDSFTYGWGINDEQSWPVLLAANLNKQDLPVEVANLGWVGKGPTDYADMAEKAIPLLKPNLVIVALWQGDDLQQLPPVELETINTEVDRTTSFSIDGLVQTIYPNMARVVQQIRQTNLDEFQRVVSGEDIQNIWQEQAKKIYSDIEKWNQEATINFQNLEPEIKKLFYDGLLNPHLIRLAVSNPDYFLEVVDMTDPATQARVYNLSSELTRIKKAASTYGAEVMVVAVPAGIYVNRHYMEASQRIGLKGNPDLLSSNWPDMPIALAAERSGLQFVSVLDSFRQSDEKHLFYDLDAHFTAEGSRLFADTLLPVVEQYIRTGQTTTYNYWPDFIPSELKFQDISEVSWTDESYRNIAPGEASHIWLASPVSHPRWLNIKYFDFPAKNLQVFINDQLVGEIIGGKSGSWQTYTVAVPPGADDKIFITLENSYSENFGVSRVWLDSETGSTK